VTGKLRGLVDAAALVEALREEQLLFEPAQPGPGPHDLRAERTIVIAMIDGWARESDLDGLDALDFYSSLFGHAYGALRGGARGVDGVAAVLSAMSLGSPERIKLALRDLVNEHDVMQWGPLRASVERVTHLSVRRGIMHAAQHVARAAERGDIHTIAAACRALEDHAPKNR